MIDFLHYVESTDERIAKSSKSERLKRIHACVSRVKSSEEAGVKYMQKWEEQIIEREKALAMGREEGREEGREATLLNSINNLMNNEGWTAERAMDALMVPEEERERYVTLINR